jgi:hypothetical protein
VQRITLHGQQAQSVRPTQANLDMVSMLGRTLVALRGERRTVLIASVRHAAAFDCCFVALHGRVAVCALGLVEDGERRRP